MLYTVKELSTLLDKNPETIRRWCRDGKLNYSQESRKEGNLIEYDANEPMVSSKKKLEETAKKLLIAKINNMSLEEKIKLLDYIEEDMGT